jgi:hypothetical protein
MLFASSTASAAAQLLQDQSMRVPHIWHAFGQMWDMREAHPLFVVIPTGARSAQRRDLLLASGLYAVTTLSVLTKARFANSTLNPLYWSGFAPANAASAAFANASAPALCPSKAFSASRERHGFVPTPPNATRARAICPPFI